MTPGAQVQRLIVEHSVVSSVELKNGSRIEADFFISAVTPEALLAILPDQFRTYGFAGIERLGSSPIVSVNLWFDQPVFEREFVGMLGTRSQWLFNKDLILSSGKRSNQVAVIISAARDFVDWNKDELVQMAIEDLNKLLPSSRSATLRHSVIVKEREATISHSIESDDLRPGPRTSIPNLILAGDWTNTGLPATIESAVMSGNVAAEMIQHVRR